MHGQPVSDQTVSQWITQGNASMPSLKNTLTPERIGLIVNVPQGTPPTGSVAVDQTMRAQDSRFPPAFRRFRLGPFRERTGRTWNKGFGVDSQGNAV